MYNARPRHTKLSLPNEMPDLKPQKKRHPVKPSFHFSGPNIQRNMAIADKRRTAID